MSTAIAVPASKTLFAICDDLTTYAETLESLEAAIAVASDEEKPALEADHMTVLARLDEIGAELADKTDAVAAVLRRIDAERDMIQDERDRLKAKQAACDRADEWLRKYVLSVMQRSGMKTLKTPTNTIYIRASDAVEVTDEGALPDTYRNAEVKMSLWTWNTLSGLASAFGSPNIRQAVEVLRVKTEPSLSAIKKAIKSGVEVSGADLVYRDNLQLR